VCAVCALCVCGENEVLTDLFFFALACVCMIWGVSANAAKSGLRGTLLPSDVIGVSYGKPRKSFDWTRPERAVGGSVAVCSCVCVYDTRRACQCSDERVARHLASLRCHRRLFPENLSEPRLLIELCTPGDTSKDTVCCGLAFV
jgi:hypothetical protein